MLKHFSPHSFRRTAVLGVALGMAVLLGVWSYLSADLVKPRPYDRFVVTSITKLMREEHLSKHPLDDEISERGLKAFLDALDPMKMYFQKSDADEFMLRKYDLDNMLADKDVSFAFTVFERFLARVDARVKLVQELLGREYDFDTQETLSTDPKAIQYAGDDQQIEDRWRRRIKYDLLVLKGDKTEGEAARDKLRRRYESFAKRMHQTDADELLEMFITSILTSYDPHTSYMSPKSMENFRILMRLNLEGIGAALQMVDGYTVISKIIPGGAADKQGKLKPEDRIVSVSNDKGEMVDVIDLKLNDVVDMIRGKAGTVVKLGVLPAGSNEMKVHSITRARIELKDSEARSEVITEGTKVDGSPLQIGVIDLPSFYMDMEGARNGNDGYKSTTRDVRKILDDFTRKGVDVVVLDLRRNGGGSLPEAISLTGLFIDQGPVVQVKNQMGEVDILPDEDPGVAWKGPLLVLTSKFSASASEILAGAIQDYRRGIIVGDTSTHGKGTVQSLLDLGERLIRINPPPLGALKITMQQFYRPNGDSTQKRGVLADIPLPSITDHMDVSEADLDYALEFDRVKAAPYGAYKMADPTAVQSLAGASQARISQSQDFAKLLRRIERYKEQKAKKMVTLNEKEFFAERAELDAEKEDEKQLEDQAVASDEVVKRDYYMNEVLAIAVDYARLLEQNRIAWLR
jgi:carboxyl-terminal processing protease